MSEIKRINIYMGVVGQAYVDKATAEKNLEAAIKNIEDINEIIAEAQAALEKAMDDLDNATDAKELAANVKQRIEGKINELDDDDLLRGELVSLLNELHANDIDGDGTNGGNVDTADDNIEFIEAQIEELRSIIKDAQDSLVLREEHRNQCQEELDNAVEIFESYLPEDDRPSQFEVFDAEEELLRARIKAVIKSLKNAENVTNAINNTSQDTIGRAIAMIIAVSEQLEDKLGAAYDRLQGYSDSLSAIKVDSVELFDAVNALENVDEEDKENLLNNINELISSLDTNHDAIATEKNEINAKIDQIVDIRAGWEANQEHYEETFSLDAFDASVAEISDVDDWVSAHAVDWAGFKSEVTKSRSKLNRYTTDATYLRNDINPDEPEPGPEPQAKYTITFKNGEETVKTITGVTGTAVDVPANPEKEGFEFVGWSTDGETVIIPIANIGENDVTYIAVWNAVEPGPGPEKHWFSVGIEEVTADNFMEVNDAHEVDEYPEEILFTNPSMEEKNWVYVLTSNDKTVDFYDPSFPQQATTKNEDTTLISGHKITITSVRIAKGGEVIIKIS